MKVIGLDVGRHSVKAYTDDKCTMFPAIIGTYRPLRLEYQRTSDDMEVAYGGKQYYIGNIALESHDGRRNFMPTKANEDTRIMGLAALYRMVDAEETIHLVIGHPIANHTADEKEAMKKLMLGQHAIEVDGRVKQITIERVDVVPECASCVYLLPSKSGTVHGIDLGGATTNFVTWQNGKWSDLMSGTLPYGVHNKELEFADLVRLIAFNIMKQIYNFSGTIYTMGGMGDSLTEALREYGVKVPVVALEEGVYANAKSYHTVGRLLAQKLQAQR